MLVRELVLQLLKLPQDLEVVLLPNHVPFVIHEDCINVQNARIHPKWDGIELINVDDSQVVVLG